MPSVAEAGAESHFQTSEPVPLFAMMKSWHPGDAAAICAGVFAASVVVVVTTPEVLKLMCRTFELKNPRGNQSRSSRGVGSQSVRGSNVSRTTYQNDNTITGVSPWIKVAKRLNVQQYQLHLEDAASADMPRCGETFPARLARVRERVALLRRAT